MKKKKAPNRDKALKPVRTLEDQLTSAQKKNWYNIKQGFVELKMAEEGKLAFRPIQELINELEASVSPNFP